MFDPGLFNWINWGVKNPIKEENGISNGKIVGINRDSFLYDCAVENSR